MTVGEGRKTNEGRPGTCLYGREGRVRRRRRAGRAGWKSAGAQERECRVSEEGEGEGRKNKTGGAEEGTK